MNYFNNLSNLVAAAGEVPEWVANSFPTIKTVLAIIITLCSLFMIVAVISQKSESNGSSAITGKADTYYNRNKNTSLQGTIKKLIMIVAIVILVLSIAFLVLNTIYPAQ
ncbi:MAG: preprotein translocase subunit SecG [Clostridia bacterium]|nr:preprotein translocase subunit SecG [Clostridia bacterium]